MILKFRHNPTTCEELSVLLGYPVKSWSTFPGRGMIVDLDVDTLNPAQIAIIKHKLEQSQISLELGDPEVD